MKRFKKRFLIFSLIFILLAAACFAQFIIHGEAFITKDNDGWAELYPAFAYYARFLKQILKDLVTQHRLIVPEWDFAIGEGSDILAALNFHAIGDPFNLLGALVPARFLPQTYSFLCILRLYLAGISFLLLCEELGYKNDTAVITGAVLYVFSGWTVYYVYAHPYFLNPPVYFPLIILGIEKVIKGKQPFTLIFAVFFALLSQLYWFYVMVCLAAIYTLVRLSVRFFGDIKKILISILKIGSYAMIGVLMAGLFLFPLSYAFLNDTRMTGETVIPLFYSLSHFEKLFGSFFLTNDTDHGIILGFSGIQFICLILLFLYKKEHKELFILTIIAIIFEIFPYFAHVFNAFSYVTSRWTFVLQLLLSVITVSLWNDREMTLRKKELAMIVLLTLLWTGLCVLCPPSRKKFIFFELGLLFAEIAVLSFLKGKNQRILLCALGLTGIILNFNHSYIHRNVYTPDEANLNYYANEAAAVSAASQEETEFFRFSGMEPNSNVGMSAGLSSLFYYWSVSNPNFTAFSKEMALMNGISYTHSGVDSRTALLALSSAKYYTSHINAPIPYGMTYESTHNVANLSAARFPEMKEADLQSVAVPVYDVYKSRYALPFGFTSDRIIPQSVWEQLSLLEKQQTMLNGIYLPEIQETGSPADRADDVFELPFEIVSKSPDAIVTGSDIRILKSGASVEFVFEGLPNSETYLTLSGLHFSESNAKAMFRLWGSNGYNFIFQYLLPEFGYYTGKNCYSANMLYSEEPLTSIKIQFYDPGEYSFDDLRITCVSMDHFSEKIEKLRENTLEDVTFGKDSVRGRISLDRDKILCLTIPCAPGWTAKVDGEEAELMRADIKYMALDLDAGEHEIELTYSRPYQKSGILCSGIGLLLLGGTVIYWKKKNYAG